MKCEKMYIRIEQVQYNPSFSLKAPSRKAGNSVPGMGLESL